MTPRQTAYLSGSLFVVAGFILTRGMRVGSAPSWGSVVGSVVTFFVFALVWGWVFLRLGRDS